MTLPWTYDWLEKFTPKPKMLTEALALYGTHEGVGTADNPTILSWAKETGVSGYSHDSIPWCGLFMALCAKRAGYAAPDGPLWALNWAKFGMAGGQPILGDILVFTRPSGGHVGLYVGEDSLAFHVLGGNTSDAVTIARIDKHRLFANRRPPYSTPSPLWKPVLLASGGNALSTNEA